MAYIVIAGVFVAIVAYAYVKYKVPAAAEIAKVETAAKAVEADIKKV